MRMKITLKLDSGELTDVIGEAGDLHTLKESAIGISSSVFVDEKLRITPSTPIVALEYWDENKNKVKPGNKRFLVAFIFNGVIQVTQAEAFNTKGAYSIIAISCGMIQNTTMLIYELTQE